MAARTLRKLAAWISPTGRNVPDKADVLKYIEEAQKSLGYVEDAASKAFAAKAAIAIGREMDNLDKLIKLIKRMD